MPQNLFFNAHHSPIGAFASFTLGFPGNGGGFDLERAQPPKESVFLVLEDLSGGSYRALPFYENGEDESKRYDMEKAGQPDLAPPILRTFPREEIARDFRLGTDTWTAGDLVFRLYSQARNVPDPETAAAEELKDVLVPAVLAELTVDNSKGTRVRRALFGYKGSDPYSVMRRLDPEEGGSLTGVGQGRHTAIVTTDDGVRAVQHFSMERILKTVHEENYKFGLGGTAALLMEVPAGEVRTYRFALVFHREGFVTTGIDAAYWYTRYFDRLETAGQYAMERFDVLKASALAADRRLAESGAGLNEDQAFMLAHAIRSYFGSTQLLDWEGRPFWIVNEGEYRMLNTFDLTVDQLFFEMRMNPWTVKNELDLYAERYSYRDQIRFPGDDRLYPGGISFTHDMGVGNAVSRPAYSSYEQAGLDDCFSYMTHEQLVNWVLCAAVYAHKSGDGAWLRSRIPLLRDCLDSMMNRDHPDPEQRNGIMGLDSSRCKGGAEITTYDSLDVSLGQARNNIYIAGKCWAAYLALERILREHGDAAGAEAAAKQARRCADTIVSHATADGYIPAVVGEGNDSRIIPAIEGLIFPYELGMPEVLEADGPYGELIRALKRHLATVLVPGTCLFADGGWKLSSTSDNSWLSKIYLCQFIARRILGLPWEQQGRRSDAAHAAWLTDPKNAFWSWSDQILAGTAVGSKYYPRGVTAVLWLEE
ncbi:glycoside hydrolase family 52 protein [Gorillibacterium sp. sgz5001074]|uniref:glycoside hydrolase family 52 protein n=1 Tax=Gorillibacterium sp. sgz5001074 TaxID=3446695 RepID=UPI003F660C72